MAHTLHSTIRRAQRRELAARAIRFAGWWLLLALILGLGLLLVDRLTALRLPGLVYLGIAAGGIAAGFVHALVRRPHDLAVAVKLDHALGLKDRIGSAVTVGDEAVRKQARLDDGFAQLVRRDAEALAGRVDVPAATPIHFTKNWIAVAGLGALLIVGMAWLPQRDVRGDTPLARAAAEREEAVQKESQALAQTIEDALQEVARPEAAAEDESIAADLAALDRLAEQLSGAMGSETELKAAKDESAARMNELAARLEEQAQRDRAAAEEIVRRFDGLEAIEKPEAPLTTQELEEAIRSGRFGKAADEIERLLGESRQLSEAERLAAANALRDLSDAVGERGEATADDVDAQERSAQLREALREQGLPDETIDAMLERQPQSADDIARDLREQGIDEEAARQLAQEMQRQQDERERQQTVDQDVRDVADALDRAAHEVESPPPLPPSPLPPPPPSYEAEATQEEDRDQGQPPQAPPGQRDQSGEPSGARDQSKPETDAADRQRGEGTRGERDQTKPPAQQQPAQDAKPGESPPREGERKGEGNQQTKQPEGQPRRGEQPSGESQRADQPRGERQGDPQTPGPPAPGEQPQAQRKPDKSSQQKPGESPPPVDRKASDQQQQPRGDQQRGDQPQTPGDQRAADRQRGDQSPDQRPPQQGAPPPKPQPGAPKPDGKTAAAPDAHQPDTSSQPAVDPSQRPRDPAAPAPVLGDQSQASDEQPGDEPPGGNPKSKIQNPKSDQAGADPSQQLSEEEMERQLEELMRDPPPAEVLRELAERARRAQDQPQISERLREKARELADNMTPEQRQRWEEALRREAGDEPGALPDQFPAGADELSPEERRAAGDPSAGSDKTRSGAGTGADPEAGDQPAAPPALNPADRIAATETDTVDLRGEETADQIIMHWLTDEPAREVTRTDQPSPEGPTAAATVRSAQKVAERAVNDAAVHKRYHRAIKRYFGRLEQTIQDAAKRASGTGGSAASEPSTAPADAP